MVRNRARWERNTSGLQRTAQGKAAATQRRAEEAIDLLVAEGRPITFTAVAETAHVSTAWLYGNAGIKARVTQLRAQQAPRPKVWVPPQERASDASKERIIAALRERIKKQDAEIRDLRAQLEVAYGLVGARSWQEKPGQSRPDAPRIE
jgi:hypothetical protein